MPSKKLSVILRIFPKRNKKKYLKNIFVYAKHLYSIDKIWPYTWWINKFSYSHMLLWHTNKLDKKCFIFHLFRYLNSKFACYYIFSRLIHKYNDLPLYDWHIFYYIIINTQLFKNSYYFLSELIKVSFHL